MSKNKSLKCNHLTPLGLKGLNKYLLVKYCRCLSKGGNHCTEKPNLQWQRSWQASVQRCCHGRRA